MSSNKVPVNKQILYLNDRADQSNLMKKRVLKTDDYSVSLGFSDSRKLDQRHGERADLIFLRLYGSDLNSHEVAHRLWQMERTRNIPVLLVNVSRDSEDKALENEVDHNDDVPNPIDVDLISEQIAASL